MVDREMFCSNGWGLNLLNHYEMERWLYSYTNISIYVIIDLESSNYVMKRFSKRFNFKFVPPSTTILYISIGQFRGFIEVIICVMTVYLRLKFYTKRNLIVIILRIHGLGNRCDSRVSLGDFIQKDKGKISVSASFKLTERVLVSFGPPTNLELI